MKNLFLTTLALLVFETCAFAQIGYVDYSQITKNYPLAKQYNSTLKAKQNDIITYAETKDKQADNAKNSADKKRIRQEGISQVEVKNKELRNLKKQYDTDLNERIQKASETVRVQKGLEMIIRADVRLSGGVDCTNEVLNVLKNQGLN